jgi:hypothetical protein
MICGPDASIGSVAFMAFINLSAKMASNFGAKQRSPRADVRFGR